MERIDHVGVAVGDLAAARELWDLLLGQSAKLEEVPTQGVQVAIYPCGIELIAPNASDSPISRFLDKRGSGIHHVTLRVDDIDAQLARLKTAGVRLIHDHAVAGAGGHRVAFVHPAATGGILLELSEHGE